MSPCRRIRGHIERMDDLLGMESEAARSEQGLADLLRPTEVAQMLGVSRSWLYGAAKDGRIPCVRLGGPDGPLRFVERDLLQWLERARASWRPGDSSATTLRRAAA
jgi:excisionase family DNA binding protein